MNATRQLSNELFESFNFDARNVAKEVNYKGLTIEITCESKRSEKADLMWRHV